MATALNRGLRSGIRLVAAGAEAQYYVGSKICPRSDVIMISVGVIRSRATRGFHATGVKRMGGHGHDEPYYVHAKHMYNLHRMKHQALKVSLSVLGAVSIGIGVPVYAVVFQQKKTASEPV
ncbi:hypothetical protein U9M48_032598 [Paspalum notatum var. saurae]|uniref:SLL1 protein n=1 Tax=Paspalum notatum var. saurae TaxID=547442 RepID=A0AAQ3X5L0_PASNO